MVVLHDLTLGALDEHNVLLLKPDGSYLVGWTVKPKGHGTHAAVQH